MNPSPFVVETAGLTKQFGDRTVVQDVELQVPHGSAFGYLGPNGAGKTTLIRMLLGLTRPTSGSMRLLGLPVPERRSEALARVGAIVEEPRFHAYLTGRENLQIVAAARDAQAMRRIVGAIERVGLARRADDRVKTYSLGMRQRLGIARILLADPELLILDEPMNGLDPAGIEEMRVLIRSLAAEGRTVVLSSHLLDEVEKTVDALAIVDQGRVIAQGSIAELTRTGPPTLVIASADNRRAGALLAQQASVAGVVSGDGTLRVRLDGNAAVANDAIADINRRLVEAGIPVYRLEPEHASLERRFLEITSRLEEAA
jgi:ABC-2 type transport system ATP-binding protein